MLNIHSHLSKNEVIGFLGGFSFESKDNKYKCINICLITFYSFINSLSLSL